MHNRSTHRPSQACGRVAKGCHWPHLAARSVSSTLDLSRTLPRRARHSRRGAQRSAAECRPLESCARRAVGDMQWSILGPAEHVAKRTTAAGALCSCNGHAMAKFVSVRDGHQLFVDFRPVLLLLCANAAGCDDERLHVSSGITEHRASAFDAVEQRVYICMLLSLLL